MKISPGLGGILMCHLHHNSEFTCPSGIISCNFVVPIPPCHAIMQPIMQAHSPCAISLDNNTNNPRPHRAGGCARLAC